MMTPFGKSPSGIVFRIKIINGGNFVPSAQTHKAAVKLHFSFPVVSTLTSRDPLWFDPLFLCAKVVSDEMKNTILNFG